MALVLATATLFSANAKSSIVDAQQTQPVIQVLWQGYPDLESLTKQADYVVLGKLETMTGTRNHPNSEHTPLTDFDVTVVNVMKGDLPAGEKIRVSQFGGPAPYARIEGDPIMKAGEEYVMFLVYDSTLDAYGYLGGPQGKFLVKESKVYSMDNVDPEADFVEIKVKDKPLNDFRTEISNAARGGE